MKVTGLYSVRDWVGYKYSLNPACKLLIWAKKWALFKRWNYDRHLNQTCIITASITPLPIMMMEVGWSEIVAINFCFLQQMSELYLKVITSLRFLINITNNSINSITIIKLCPHKKEISLSSEIITLPSCQFPHHHHCQGYHPLSSPSSHLLTLITILIIILIIHTKRKCQSSTWKSSHR